MNSRTCCQLVRRQPFNINKPAAYSTDASAIYYVEYYLDFVTLIGQSNMLGLGL